MGRPKRFHCPDPDAILVWSGFVIVAVGIVTIAWALVSWYG